MEKISLEIHQDEKFNFFANYDKLSKIQKEIWKLAVWWVKRYPNAHPNQSTIAKKAKCRREHVNRTFALFKEWGWLGLGYRGRRLSKTLTIPKVLVQIDLVNREWFARIEITSKRTYSYFKYRDLTSRRAGEKRMCSLEEIQPSPLGQKFGYSDEGCLKLGLLPDFLQQEALRKSRDIGTSGWRPDNQERYFLGIAFQLAKDAGFKVNWPAYYQTLKRKAA